jgi:hypothetical protein
MNTYTITLEIEAKSHSEAWKRVLDTALYRDVGKHFYFKVPGRLLRTEMTLRANTVTCQDPTRRLGETITIDRSVSKEQVTLVGVCPRHSLPFTDGHLCSECQREQRETAAGIIDYYERRNAEARKANVDDNG